MITLCNLWSKPAKIYTMYIWSQYWLTLYVCVCLWMCVTGCMHMCVGMVLCVYCLSARHNWFLRKHRHHQDPTTEVGWHQEILFFCIRIATVTFKLKRFKKKKKIQFDKHFKKLRLNCLMCEVRNLSLTIHFLQVFFIITAFFGTGNIASINRYVRYFIHVSFVYGK